MTVCKPSSPLCLLEFFYYCFFFNLKHSYPQKSLHSIVKETSTPHVRNPQFLCSDEVEALSLHSEYQVEPQMRHTRAQLAELRLLSDLKRHNFSNVNIIFTFSLVLYLFHLSQLSISSLMNTFTSL